MILGGRDDPHYVEINVWADQDDYIAHADDAPEWAGGNFSVQSRHGVTTRRIDLTQRDARGRFAVIMLDRVLPHEMCHLVVHEYFGDAACPLFLNEGLAMLAECEVDNQRVIVAGTTLAGGEPLSLRDLFARERHNMGEPGTFYAASFSFVEFLHSRMTEDQFTEFLAHVKDGCFVCDAIQRALCSPDTPTFPTDLESAWQSHAILQAQITRALAGR
jgi:hypothetical protein